MDRSTQRILLQQIARKAMIERGLESDFPIEVLSELKEITFPAIIESTAVMDMRNLLWCSVDNLTSLDLDQLSYVEPLSKNRLRLLVAIADVEELVSD